MSVVLVGEHLTCSSALWIRGKHPVAVAYVGALHTVTPPPLSYGPTMEHFESLLEEARYVYLSLSLLLSVDGNSMQHDLFIL